MRTVLLMIMLGIAATTGNAQSRPGARDLGIAPGTMEPGPLNAITDVAGVRVGQVTVVQGDNVRTGVTAVLPHSGNLFQQKVAGAVFIGNAFGKLAGSTQVDELGTIETPIVLTNTLSVGTALEAIVRWTVAQPGNENVRSVNALVGETNDGGLNDIRGLHVTREHVQSAIANAKEGAVEEGAVGAGTGTVAFNWKGGIGTSSRLVRQRDAQYTVGVLVQTNYGGKLTIAGVPVWKELTPRAPQGNEDLSSEARSAKQDVSSEARSAKQDVSSEARSAKQDVSSEARSAKEDGSCMIVVATDAPLSARDLKRLAARAVYAMARTGSTFSNGSGDFAIAFSTKSLGQVSLPTDAVSGLFEATMDATEEAIYNSMLKATDTSGNGRTIRALPVDDLKALLKKYGR
jgi:D-aminopeptidase